MKNLIRPFLLCSIMLAAIACNVNKDLRLVQVEPLVKVFHTDSIYSAATDTALVARGENATFQFVLDSDVDAAQLVASFDAPGLGETYVGWVHDVTSTNSTSGADDMMNPSDNLYPDPILDDYPEEIAAGSHRVLHIDVAIPRDTKPGLYKCSVTVVGKTDKEIKATAKCFVKVYPVTLPQEQNLTVVNWISTGSFSAMNKGEKVEYGSDQYFEILKEIAIMAAKNGQNCWLIPSQPDHILNDTKDGFILDFTVFDKTLDVLEQYGNMKYFCNPHIGGRFKDAAWTDEMAFNICTVESGEIVKKTVGYKDPELKKYIDCFFPQFEAHLREKGLLNRCYQHVADEPTNTGTPSQISYCAVAGMIKQAAPSLRIIDACSEILENQDVSVVILRDNIATMPPVAPGQERWMYTCCEPVGNYANRFLQLPLLKTRILHWINYRYGECGYLHWGYNFWGLVEDPMNDVTPKTTWPGGDCYIIYPGDHKVYPSIRLGAMRDGIRDYDLLKMIEERDPQKAMDICCRIIQGPDKYNTDIRHFYQIRKEMLEYLSK